MNFSRKIKQARLDQNLTQDWVARQLHLSRKTISSWENARSYPDIASLVKLSNLYQMSLDQLLKEDEAMIKHFQEQSNNHKRNAMIATICYYLNIGLLFFVIINQHWNVSPLLTDSLYLWIINLIILATFYDFGRLNTKLKHFTKLTSKRLQLMGIILLTMTIFLSLFPIGNVTPFLLGKLYVQTFFIVITALSISFAVFGNPKSSE